MLQDCARRGRRVLDDGRSVPDAGSMRELLAKARHAVRAPSDRLFVDVRWSPVKINVDIDGVLADFVSPLLLWVLKRCGKLYDVDTINHYPGYETFEPDHKNIVLKHLGGDATFCYNIPRRLGSQQFIKTLLEHGHDVHLVTSHWPGPHWRKAREEWIESFLAFPGGNRVAWEFIGEERKNLPGDILIDDVHEAAAAWAGTRRKALLIDHPWNRFPEPLGVFRTKTWDETLLLIEGIYLVRESLDPFQ